MNYIIDLDYSHFICNRRLIYVNELHTVYRVQFIDVYGLHVIQLPIVLNNPPRRRTFTLQYTDIMVVPFSNSELKRNALR